MLELGVLGVRLEERLIDSSLLTDWLLLVDDFGDVVFDDFDRDEALDDLGADEALVGLDAVMLFDCVYPLVDDFRNVALDSLVDGDAAFDDLGADEALDGLDAVVPFDGFVETDFEPFPLFLVAAIVSTLVADLLPSIEAFDNRFGVAAFDDLDSDEAFDCFDEAVLESFSIFPTTPQSTQNSSLRALSVINGMTQ